MKMQLDGAILNVAERGTGPDALVFLHYFGGSGQSWSSVAAQLAGRWRCVMPDLRGFGESDAIVGSFSVNDAADDVVRLVRGLQLEHWQLVGHSMGAKIAMAVAARQPPGLTRLVLLAPSPPTPEPIEDPKRAHMLASQLDRTAAQEAAHASCGQRLSEKLFRQMIEDRLRTSPAAWRWWLGHGSKEDIASAMQDIKVPVAVLSGTLDTDIPTEVVKGEVMTRLQTGNLQVLPGMGHILPLEAPVAVAQAIQAAPIKDQAVH